ncbi:uncharacterized protein LOC106478882 [Limulus polyphemus]|uniref:Uncharacterized protein LOC106478882 n=1 Tax=Limulus polyphemus TaxID=6850 RepID=A0ABM1C653_LIMPO|nr:uncharacterized protein LOC106478882 [Limulus polyphemus]
MQDNIEFSLIQVYKNSVKSNRAALLSTIDIILALAQINIPFRGNWNEELHEEDGNFNFLIQWKSKVDIALQLHLETALGNAHYMSPKIQNEILEFIKKEIRQQIRLKTDSSAFLSIMADESCDCLTQAQLAIVVRYLFENEVHEDFLGFINLERTDVATISCVVLSDLENWGFDLTKLCCQGYDGCSTTNDLEIKKDRKKKIFEQLSLPVVETDAKA